MERITYRTDDELDTIMRERGLHFYRGSFRWGTMPAYKNATSTLYRFVDRGDILTPAALLVRLSAEWHPAARKDIDYAAHTMRREIEELTAMEDRNASQNCER